MQAAPAANAAPTTATVAAPRQNVVIKPKKSNDSMIVPASGRVLLAEDLGGIYGNTVVIEHGVTSRAFSTAWVR